MLLGTGMEDDDEAARLVEEVLEASTTAGIPLYVETHRATVTQDMWRTVQLVERFPELRFNGDFSHWYTGHDLPMGDFEAKLDLLGPVLERVRYLHGRIGTSGCIQVDVGDGRPADEPPVVHFREMWTRAMAGFVRTARNDAVPEPGLQLGFAPELLPPRSGTPASFPGRTAGWRRRGTAGPRRSCSRTSPPTASPPHAGPRPGHAGRPHGRTAPSTLARTSLTDGGPPWTWT